MSNRKNKSVDPSVNPFTIAAQLSATANNINDESSTNSEEENNPRQLKVPRLAKESLNWNSNWPKIYPWVYRGEGQLNKYMFCHWCIEAGKNNNFTKGCGYFKKQSLDCHISTSDHEMVCAARMQSQVNLYSSFAIQAGNDQIKIMKNMRNIYFLIQHNLSINLFESLCKLFEIQRIENQDQFECGTEILNIFDNDFSIDDERAPYGSYQNHVSAHEFIESIGRIIEQEVFQELRNSDGWSIMLDESYTISNEKTLAIVSKHAIVPAKPLYRFLGLISLIDSTANAIMAEIDQFVLAKNISYNKLMHICTDGVHNGISTQLKNKNPFILEHHCISHKLALAAKDAAKQVEEFKSYEKTVHNIYSYFSRSVECMIHLKMIEENTGDPQLTVLNIIETRWLSLSNVIQNLHQILNSIINALLEDSDENIIAKALYDIKTQLDITIHTIQVQFLGTDILDPTWGIHLRKYIIDNGINTIELPAIITKFANATIESLEKRFPNRNQIDAFHIFDPKALPINNSDFQNYGEDEIEILGNFYGQDKYISGNLFPAILNSENLKHEWLSVRYLLTNYKNLNFLEAWQRIFLDLSTFNEIYPETTKLISILINLPLTNAVVE
ncbi:31562_t:CDS:2 [Gigaspora margarita]|uniref:31562_t:CDS:1 n=1 Tax=Gigaspora margarita TaxID=4874 RepID=A0ABN7VV73_GIGMA|nr:31562_t:CDS:2 [Gigaspora margarita]